MLGVLLLPTSTRLRHECRDLLSPCDGMHVCTDETSVYTLIRKSFKGMDSEPMLTPREKSPLPEQFSPEEHRTHDAASNRTASLTSNQRAILAQVKLLNPKQRMWIKNYREQELINQTETNTAFYIIVRSDPHSLPPTPPLPPFPSTPSSPHPMPSSSSPLPISHFAVTGRVSDSK